MDQDLELIRRLADGEFHSGADLGASLGISRAAIWKRMQRLAELGIELQSVRGKGYRVRRALSLIDPDRLDAMLPRPGLLVYRPITGSTNADAQALGAAGARAPLVVTTECQSAGRGRRGRQWQSPFAANLYLSVLFQMDGGFSSLAGLSLAAGVAISDALSEMCPGLEIGLKWPNDLLVKGAKLGGVLIELAGELDGRVQVVVGFGLNVAMPEPASVRIDQPWTDLVQACEQVPPRTRLAAGVGNALLAMLTRFSAEGFDPFMEAFQRLDLSRDRPVVIHVGDRRSPGIARGVGPDGALRVEMDGVVQEVHGGEVSLRLQ